MTQANMWQQAGLPGIACLPRIRDKWISINYLLSMFPLFRFDISGTERAYPYWLSYRMKPALGEDGAYKNEIVHDSSSHWADSLRYIAEARMMGLLKESRGVKPAVCTKRFGSYFLNLMIGGITMTSSLEERGGEVLRAFGISFETAWEEHRHLLRRRYSDGLVMGHFFHISEGWEDMEGVWENVKECCNPSNSVGRNEANGFSFIW